MLEVIKREAVYLWYYFSVQLEHFFPTGFWECSWDRRFPCF